MPPALLLMVRGAKLEMGTAGGIVVTPTLTGGVFSLVAALTMAVVMAGAAHVLRWVEGIVVAGHWPAVGSGRVSAAPLQHRGTLALGTLGVLCGAGGYYASNGMIAASRRPISGITQGLSRGSAFGSVVAFVVALVVITPVFEELFFRGAMQRVLTSSLTVYPGLILGSLAFAIAHPSKGHFPLFLGMGLVFSVLAHYSRSLIPTILAHATFNALTVVALLMAK